MTVDTETVEAAAGVDDLVVMVGEEVATGVAEALEEEDSEEEVEVEDMGEVDGKILCLQGSILAVRTRMVIYSVAFGVCCSK